MKNIRKDVFLSGSLPTEIHTTPFDKIPDSSAIALSCSADIDPYGNALPCWLEPNRYDDAFIFEQLEKVSRNCDNARIIVNIISCSPHWWDDLHPEDLVVWEDGSTEHPLSHGCLKTQVPSMASSRWRHAMLVNIARLVSVLESSDFKDRIIGYTAGFGHLGSWTHFGTTEGYHFDFNQQVTVRFQEWLKAKYKDDITLSRAWGRPSKLSRAAAPDVKMRAAVDPTGFRDPCRFRNVIDYKTFMSELIAQNIKAVASTVKNSCHWRCFFGVSYGDFLNLLASQNGLQNSGQLGLHATLDDPCIDFYAAPATASGLSSAPEMSVRLHGKALFNKVDLNTISDKDQAVKEARAHFAAHGHRIWWENSSAPDELIKSFNYSGKRKDSIIALVLDDVSMYYLERQAEQFVALITNQAKELLLSGHQFDIILRRDLSVDLHHKLLIFPNFFAVDLKTRRSIHSLLQEKSLTALWVGAPGFVDKEPGFENMESLAGIHICKPDKPHRAIISVQHEGVEIQYGAPGLVAHTPIINDPECKILGCYQDSLLPGLGIKTINGWTSIYSGVPAVCAKLIKQFVSKAQ